jgi:uncharacterized protein (TIGR03790 family)
LVELWISDKERCSRKDYEERAVYKIRKHLKEKDPNHQIRCLVTMYGVPLKVQPPEMTKEEKKQVEDLRKSRKILNERIKALDDRQKEQIKKLRDKSSTVEKRISVLTKNDHRASFDSELALVLRGDYALSGWVLNPFFIGFKNKKLINPSCSNRVSARMQRFIADGTALQNMLTHLPGKKVLSAITSQAPNAAP